MIKDYLHRIRSVCEEFKDKNSSRVLIDKVKRYKCIILVMLLFIIGSLVINLLAGKDISKEECLDKFKVYLETGDKKLNDYLYVDDKKVGKDDLQYVIDYYIDDDKARKVLISDLTKKNKCGRFQVKEKKQLFSDRYYINIEKIEVSFKFDNNKTKVFMGTAEKIRENKKYELIPGTYNIETETDTKYGKIKNEFSLDIFQEGTIDIGVGGEYITIYSNVKDAEVYINNIKAELPAGDIKEYGPLPKDKNIKVYLKKDFPWGTIKSDEVALTPYINLDINIVNEKLIADIDKILNDFYTSVFEALNNKDEELIVNATSQAKSKIYDYINQKTLFFSNNYELSNLKVKIEKSEFSVKDDEYVGSVLTKLNYKVCKKLLPFMKEDKEEMFLLTLKYEEDDWILTGGEKISINDEQ